jgi:hypothetical protein
MMRWIARNDFRASLCSDLFKRSSGRLSGGYLSHVSISYTPITESRLAHLLPCHELHEGNFALKDETGSMRREVLPRVIFLDELLDVADEIIRKYGPCAGGG